MTSQQKMTSQQPNKPGFTHVGSITLHVYRNDGDNDDWQIEHDTRLGPGSELAMTLMTNDEKKVCIDMRTQMCAWAIKFFGQIFDPGGLIAIAKVVRE